MIHSSSNERSMLTNNEIVVVGSHAPGLLVRVRRIPGSGETVIGWDYQEPVDGGKGSNQAIAAARLGASVSFVGCVGKDRIGDTGEGWMRDAGVDTHWLLRSETTASGLGFIMLDENGVPAMVTCMGANEELSTSDVDQALADLSGVRVLLTQFEIDPDVALHAARSAAAQGIIPIVNPAPAVNRILRLEPAVILTPNETEAKVLLGLDPGTDADLARLARDLRTQTDAGTVIITAGEKGIIGSDAAGEWETPAFEVQVVDTSGAGDVFCAALALALVRGKSTRAASAEACAIASLSVTKAGTIPAYPTWSEAEPFLKKHGLLP
jgi:ribokinase